MRKLMLALTVLFVFVGNAYSQNRHQTFEDGSYFNDDYMYEEDLVNKVQVETPSDIYEPEVEMARPLPISKKPFKKPRRRPSSTFQEVNTSRGHGGDFHNITLDQDYLDHDVSYGSK